jgi:integrase
LTELPQWQRSTIRPWSADEAKQFRGAARPDPLYAAFVLMILYGLRRGETLGLRWTDIDFAAGTIQVRQQLQRIQGRLVLGVATERWLQPARQPSWILAFCLVELTRLELVTPCLQSRCSSS